MQVDTLVQLLESPIFVHMRLQLLNVDSKHHAPLLKSLYGLLMLIPQSDAFRSLNDRLTTVCNLRENLGMSQPVLIDGQSPLISKTLLNAGSLLRRFDFVMGQYQTAKEEADKVELLDYLPTKTNMTINGDTTNKETLHIDNPVAQQSRHSPKSPHNPLGKGSESGNEKN